MKRPGSARQVHGEGIGLACTKFAGGVRLSVAIGGDAHPAGDVVEGDGHDEGRGSFRIVVVDEDGQMTGGHRRQEGRVESRREDDAQADGYRGVGRGRASHPVYSVRGETTMSSMRQPSATVYRSAPNRNRSWTSRLA